MPADGSGHDFQASDVIELRCDKALILPSPRARDEQVAVFNKVVCRVAAAESNLFVDGDPASDSRAQELAHAENELAATRSPTIGGASFKLCQVVRDYLTIKPGEQRPDEIVEIGLRIMVDPTATPKSV